MPGTGCYGVWKPPKLFLMPPLPSLIDLRLWLLDFDSGVPGIHTRTNRSMFYAAVRNKRGRPERFGCSDFSEENYLLRWNASSLSSILTTHPPYEAISYTWMDQESSIEIIVNHKALKVTPNVSEILEYRHSFTGTRLFWIDSICIYMS